MTQIAIAEPLAKPGETVMSPEACELAGRVIMVCFQFIYI